MRKVVAEFVEGRFIIVMVEETNGLPLQNQGFPGADFSETPGSDRKVFSLHHFLLLLALWTNLGLQWQQVVMCASGGILINMEFDGWGLHTNLFLQLGNNMLGTIVATTQHTVPVWLWHGPNWLAHHGVSSLFGPFVEVLTISSEHLFLTFIKILDLFVMKLPSRAGWVFTTSKNLPS